MPGDACDLNEDVIAADRRLSDRVPEIQLDLELPTLDSFGRDWVLADVWSKAVAIVEI